MRAVDLLLLVLVDDAVVVRVRVALGLPRLSDLRAAKGGLDPLRRESEGT